jgi:hypothetical protein
LETIVKIPSSGNVAFQLAFWAVVFTINVGPEWHKYSSAREIIEVAGLTTLLQMLVALVAVRLLVPRWLDRGAVVGFLAMMLLALVAAVEVNVLVSYLYLEPAYSATYGAYYIKHLVDLSMLERLGFSYVVKYLLLSKLPLLAFPAAILIAVDYYQRQRTLLALKERQRAAELEALKNQLNPHFIFNTLNNIYALALQRSTQTAEAVARLSSILDYVLHHGSEPLVSLREEVSMIEAYIALEQLRFGDRLQVEFRNEASPNLRVPPLLFLTLLENAFKHGVAKSLRPEQIEVALTENDQQLCFEVKNSVPPGSRQQPRDDAIGLRNLRRQLALQCPDLHQLTVTQDDKQHTARLVLDQPCQSPTPASSLTMKSSAAS